MRIHFRNLGHAEYCLKECRKSLLKEAHLPEKTKAPSSLIRNAFCKAFGYSSYEEFNRLCVISAGDAWQELNTEALGTAVTRGWAQASQFLNDLTSDLPGEPPAALLSSIQTSFLNPHSEELKRLADGFESLRLIEVSAYYKGELGGIGGAIAREGARRAFRDVLNQNPDSVDALNALAELAWRNENYAEVKRLSTIAIEKSMLVLGDVSPDAYEWWNVIKTRAYMKALWSLGSALWRLGEYASAISKFEELTLLKPGRPGMVDEVLLNIGNIQVESGDFAGALLSYSKCDKLSKAAQASYNRAYALIQTDNIEEAIQQLRAAFKLDGNIARNLLGLEEITDYRKGIKIFDHPDDEKNKYANGTFGNLWKGNERAFALLKTTYENSSALNMLSLLGGLKEAMASTLDKSDGDKVREYLSKEILALDSSDRTPAQLNHHLLVL